jgi:eukaryotic-like serine/threonine-protein kinase
VRRAPLLAILALALGASSARAAGVPIVIGLLLPPEEPEAESIRRGARVAVEEANAEGTSVRLAVRGRKGAWGSDAAEAARLVEDDEAVALIAPPDGAGTHLVLQIAGRTGVPIVSLCPDLSVTRTAIPWMVRVAPSGAAEARALFEAARISRWLAVVPQGRAGREAASDLASVAGSRSLVVVEDGRGVPLARRVLDGRIEGVLLWLAPEPAARLARAFRGAGFAGTLAGPSRLATRSFRAAAGTAAQGFVVASPLPAPGAAGAVFAARFQSLFGEEPDSSALLAHDATALLIGLVASSGAEGARRAFPLARPMRGASGSLAFDGHGNRIVSLAPVILAADYGRARGGQS